MDLFKLLGNGASFKSKKTSKPRILTENDEIVENEINVQNMNNNNNNADNNNNNMIVPELDFFSIKDSDKNSKIKLSKDEELKRLKDIENTKKNILNSQQLKLYTHENLLESYIPFNNLQEVNQFRKLHKIKIYPQTNDISPPIQNFKELSPRFDVKSYLIRNIMHDRFTTPTPIQMQSIPIILDKKDLLACAPTGTGKTLSYLIPLLILLKNPSKANTNENGGNNVRCLIISPTRELALQVDRELQRLIKSKPFKTLVLTNKGSLANNNNSKSNGRIIDVLISTPQKLVSEIQNGNINLSNCSNLVLDEADRLLDMGFLEQMDEIIASCNNPNLQKILFSATIPSGIETLAKTFMNDPIRVTIGLQNSATELIDQKLLFVGQEQGKILAVRQLLQNGELKPPVLIFVETIDRAKHLFHELVYEGINVDVMHGERSKKQRDQMVQGFREGKIWVLICTELLARGIDFKGVNLVINYDFPTTVQSYIHRIGRTGRAGKKGEAITFFTKEDRPDIMKVVNAMKNSGCEIPKWLDRDNENNTINNKKFSKSNKNKKFKKRKLNTNNENKVTIGK